MLSDSLKLVVDSLSVDLKLSVSVNDSLCSQKDSMSMCDYFRNVFNDLLPEVLFKNSTETVFKALEFPETSIRWGCLVLIFLVLLLVFAFVKVKGKSLVTKFTSNHMLILSVIIWLFGTLIYILGFYKPSLPWLAVIPRAVISSFKMFTLGHDLARVHSDLQVNAWYMSIFAVVHFAAAFVTFVFIFKMIGFKLKSSWNVFKCTWNPRLKDKTVHLFWGVNNASCLLAQDINEQYKNDIIIVIDIDEDSNDNSKKKVTLNRITNTITITESEMQIFEDIHALVDHCYDGPASLTFLEENKNSKKINIFKILHLKRIGKIVERAGKVNCYFLSNDETQNILGALNVSNDWRIKEKSSERACAYIHARRDANNEVFDHYSQYNNDSKMIFKLIDSAYLSVKTLKEKYDTLPISCVNDLVKTDTGTVSMDTPFTSLLIGFGETGQEAFEFLYEFATFIGPDRRKVPFKCYAMDDKMNTIAGFITSKMPEIVQDKELEMLSTKVDSEEFWDKVREIIDQLNYVVIALNNDTVGLSLAVNIFKYALQHRTSKMPLKIALRCNDSTKEQRIDEVTAKLNGSITGCFGKIITIVPFGKEKDIYRCSTVIEDETLKKAKEYHYIYIQSSAKDLSQIKDTPEEQWKYDFGIDAISKKTESMCKFHAIYDINRQISQNISNVLHDITKLRLMGLKENTPTERLKQFNEIVQYRNEITYTCNNESLKLLLRNMAVLEHERWISAHKLMGYSWGDKKNLANKKLPDMCPFDKLSDSTQSYDYNVVDTTIKLANKKSKKD